MVNTNLLAAKWTELAERLAQVRKHRRPSVPEFEADRDATELVVLVNAPPPGPSARARAT